MLGLFTFNLDPWQLVGYLITLPVAMIALSFHEASHAFVADKLGDPTAKSLGRITMNPFKHLDLLGTLCMVIGGFGWAKPVPVNSRYFEKPKRDMTLTAIAGPVSNFILFFVGLIVYAVFNEIAIRTGLVYNESLSILLTVVYSFLFYFYYYNLILAVFNLIPIPPFDGSRLAFVFLPDKLYFGVMKYERFIMLALIVLLVSGILDFPTEFIASGICGGFERILKLIPFFEHL